MEHEDVESFLKEMILKHFNLNDVKLSFLESSTC